MKKSVFYFLMFLPTFTHAQEIVFEKELKLKRNLVDHRESYPVIDEQEKSVSLFLVDKANIQGFLFDERFNVINELDGKKPDNKFADLIASVFNDNTYHLIFSTLTHDSFVRTDFNYQTQKVETKPIDLTLHNEIYVGAITNKTNFYILTSTKNTSRLTLYTFDKSFTSTPHIFDFPDLKFVHGEGQSSAQSISLYHMLHRERPVFIDNTLPNPLDLTSAPSKLYCFDDKIILTLDYSLSQTDVITLDLNSLQSSLQSFPQPEIKTEKGHASANSYLYKHSIFQFKGSLDELIFSIRQPANPDASVRSYKASVNDNILFKNTPIILEKKGTVGFLTDSERELNKTKQFLKKLSGSNAGVSAYQIGDTLTVTLGSFIETESSYGSTGSMVTGAGHLNTPYGPAATPSYNPMFNSYKSYSYSKSAYFKSVFDANTLDHADGMVPSNAFDKIEEFLNAKGNEVTAETIFKLNNSYILGYYQKGGNDKYMMRKFSD